MAILPSSNAKTLTLNSSELFIKSYTQSTQASPQTSPPLPFTLLSKQSPLPHIPTDIPQSKLIPKTRFIIDGFRNSGTHSVSYFLSHFHSDHYTGLNPNWAKGMIFCSKITAKLLVEVLNVSPLFVVELSLDEVVCIDGCEVTLIDANHCPGAVQFLFKVAGRKGKKDKRYVHTGDFRFCSSMKLEPMLSEFVGADGIFLDTTYCNPRFNFPTQDESIEYIVETINRIRVENKGLKKSVLFLIATYVVGKEKILIEVSRKCNCMIHVDNRKMTVFSALGFGETGMFTEDASMSDVHVIGWNMLGETWPYFRPNFVKMKEIMIQRGYSKVVGFVPTGWMYKVKRDGFPVKSKDSFEIHLVPYSEHSSYDELREYVRFLKPKRVIPTVGLDIEKLDSKHAIAMQKHFAGLVDEMANKQEFLMGFHRNPLQTAQKEEAEQIIDPNKGVGEQKEEAKHIIDPNKGVGEQKEEAEHIIDPNKGVGGDLNLQFQEKFNNTDLDSVSDSRSLLKVPGSNDSVANDKDPEEMIQELRDCLPVWVSRDQMLDLLTRSDGNIIEAVSDFYERETEYHEHVIACRESFVVCQTSPLSDSASFPELVSNKGTPHGPVISTSAKTSLLTNLASFPALLSNKSTNVPVVTPLTRAKKSTNITPSIKRTVSPRKRGSGLESRKNKKARQNSTLGSNGSKQATITKFFSKLVSGASQDDGVGSAKSEQCPSNENLLPCDAVEPYKEEVNQFLELIDRSISMTHAASILEKANGDINTALDIYNNSCGEIENKEERLVFHSKSAQTQSCVDNCSAGNEKKSSEETKNISTLYVQGLSTGNVTATHVSLPLEKYSPIEHACWCAGQPAPYLHLARTFDLLEREKGKIKSTTMLCNMFRSLLALSPEDVLPAVYLCTNKIAADHENRELNIGGGTVTSALEEACGTNRSKIREMYNNLGDLGDVAQLCRQTQTLLAPPCALSIQQVFSVLQKISVETGSGSSVRKKNLILNLMRSCREKEMKFLVRTLVRNLRIGAMLRTVLPALAQSVVINSSPNFLCERGAEGLKEKLQCISAAVVEAYNILPNLDLLVPSLLNKGTEFSSTTLSMVPGVPIKPMLARITNGVPQALKLFQGRAFTCEYKYDGQRAQIHKLADGSVRVFSRNGDETTFKFPDLVDIIKQSSKPTAITFIVDAEVVAVDKRNGCKLMSFQELSTRERGNKSSFIQVDSIKVDICVFVFDIMFSNGEQLLGYPLRRRRQYLKELFLDDKLGSFGYAKEITVEAEDSCLSSEATLTKINSFLEDSIRSSCEGIMVKSLDVDAGYAPSKRTDTWLKVKRDYLDGLNDSLDLVPIGAWHGNGRKAGWYSPFLMACYNPDTEEFQSVCRVMSGFSDVFYLEMKEFFSDEKVLSKKPPYYQTSEVPDKWFSPDLVWEIKGADFTISPVHQAAIGLVHPSRGISIRFPRFIHSVSDRKAEDCSTSEDIADMFRSQTRKMDISMDD